MQIQRVSIGYCEPNEPVLFPGVALYENDGTPYQRGMARVQVIQDSIEIGPLPTIFITGGKGDGTTESEAFVIETELRRRIGEEALANTGIIREEASTNSLLNFINVAEELRAQQPGALNIVTDWAHMPRLCLIARKILHRGTEIVPVVTKHMPSRYETYREIPAVAATLAVVGGKKRGDIEALLHSTSRYISAKEELATILGRR